ncbi:MAG: hypothetical protein WCA28_16745 [Bradyrhizobium sp.]
MKPSQKRGGAKPPATKSRKRRFRVLTQEQSDRAFDRGYELVKQRRVAARLKGAAKREEERQERIRRLSEMTEIERERFLKEEKAEYERMLAEAVEACFQSLVTGDRSKATAAQRRLLNFHDYREWATENGCWPPKSTARKIEELKEKLGFDPFVGSNHFLLRRFDCSVPRHPSAGPAKDNRRIYRRKWEALLQAHIELRTDCVDVVRIDIDRDFGSVETLIEALKSCNLPCMPHVAVWKVKDGEACRPHLLFFLPEGWGVWYDARQRRMLAATAAGITERLQAIGADPGGMANLHDTKNPKSPDCDFRILNDTHLPKLKEYLAHLRMSVEPVVLAKRMALMQLRAADFDNDQSNDLWTWAQQATWDTGKLIDMRGLSGLSSVPTPDEQVYFKYKIIDHLTPEAEKIYDLTRAATKRAVLKVLEQTAWYVATHIRKGEPGVRRGRRIGAASHLVEQRLSEGTERTKAEAITAAQSAGGAFSSMNRRARSLDEISKAVVAIMVTGGRVTQAAIVRATGKSERTVRTYWPAALSAARSMVSAGFVAAQEELAPEPAKQSQRRGQSGRKPEIPAQTAKPTPPTITGGWSYLAARAKPSPVIIGQLRRQPGDNVIAFLRRGNIVRYGGDNRATQALKAWLGGGVRKTSTPVAKPGQPQ